MIEGVQACGVKKDAVVDVADKGVIGPAVPQPGHDIEKFAGPAVALAMFHLFGHAEIARGVRVRGGHQVPAGAAAAQMVERGKAARNQIGRLKGG